MSKSYQTAYNAGENRLQQHNNGFLRKLENILDKGTLLYLDEKIINHLLDSEVVRDSVSDIVRNRCNDFSFFTAPAYKALEGFLFQIAEDLQLLSAGKSNLVGSYYFDEEKVDRHINKLLKELEQKTEGSKLSTYEKRDVKDRIKEMKGFLQHYRHTPAHFLGESINTVEKADRNINTIYGVIDNLAKILLRAQLIKS